MAVCTVTDILYGTDLVFQSNLKALSYIMKRKAEIISMHRQDEPGKMWEVKIKLDGNPGSIPYELYENDEPIGTVLILK